MAKAGKGERCYRGEDSDTDRLSCSILLANEVWFSFSLPFHIPVSSLQHYHKYLCVPLTGSGAGTLMNRHNRQRQVVYITRTAV